MPEHRKIQMGEQYGRLTPFEDLGVKQISASKRARVYLCKCICGNTVEVPGPQLGKQIKSCGRLQRDVRERDIPAGTVFGRLTVLRRAESKKEGKGYWYLCRCSCEKNTECIVRGSNLRSGETRSCGCLHDEHFAEVSLPKAHKTNFVENTNLGKIRQTRLGRNNTSGVCGVSWHRGRNMWCARITFQKKDYSLGYFHNIEDAAIARRQAEKNLFGEFLTWYYEQYPDKKK